MPRRIGSGAMHPRQRRLEGSPARGRILASALSAAVLIVTAACGATSPSPATSGPAATPAPHSTADPHTSAAPIGGGNWSGFRGHASRMRIGVLGPTGNPTLNSRIQAAGAVPNDIAIVGDAVYFAS